MPKTYTIPVILLIVIFFTIVSTSKPLKVFAKKSFEEIVYDSPYNHVIILKKGNIVSFRRMENGATISAIDVTNPAVQIIGYNKALFAPAFFKTSPSNVLSIGLGAGSFNRLFNKAYTMAKLTTVEIDKMIVNIASKYTGFSESSNNIVEISDGRIFLRQEKDKRWDWIILDAFIKNSQIPPHLTTVEFYELVSKRLSDDGVMASNIHSGNKLFNSHVTTMRKVFPQVIFFSVPRKGNVIAVCANFSKPNLHRVLLSARIDKMADLKAYGVDFSEMRANLIQPTSRIINQSGVLLTDDFAPVEFLEMQKIH